MKYLFLVLSLFAFFFSVAFPAEASLCRNYNNHHICIINIKRSAKNYWEYRAEVSVDDVKRPIEVYNCRDRMRVKQDGTTVPFEQNDLGKFVCSLFRKSY
jgi:hypothetical protein